MSVVRPWDLPVALALLTRLPLPRIPEPAFARQADAAWAFPVVGLIIGAISAAAAGLALAIGLPLMLAAGLCLAVQIVITGAMHEDGLADTADGFWGAWIRDRRLEIMNDSQIGTYGVLALVLSLGLRWIALGAVLAISPWLLLPIAAVSRAGIPAIMAALPSVRPGGLSDHVGQPSRKAVALSLLLGLIIAAVFFGVPLFLVTILITAVVLVGCTRLAQAKIGGQTGDVLGASQQMAELALLLSLAAFAEGDT